MGVDVSCNMMNGVHTREIQLRNSPNAILPAEQDIVLVDDEVEVVDTNIVSVPSTSTSAKSWTPIVKKHTLPVEVTPDGGFIINGDKLPGKTNATTKIEYKPWYEPLERWISTIGISCKGGMRIRS